MASIFSSDSLFNVPEDPNATRRCIKCHLYKPLTEFPPDYFRKDGMLNRSGCCRECVRKRKRTYYNYRDSRDNHLRFAYNGFTLAEFEAMEERQGGVCACCGNPPSQYTGGRRKRTKDVQPQLHVDHDHKTGKVRALLCHECNASVGHLHEDLERVRQLYHYIATHCLPTDE